MKKLSDSELGTLYVRVEKTIAAGHQLCDKLREEINKRNIQSLLQSPQGLKNRKGENKNDKLQ